MLKYINYSVTFAEIPDETSLCFSISNCDGLCEGCHSPELRENRGEILGTNIDKIIDEHNYGITCICFLGEGRKDPYAVDEMKNIINHIRKKYPKLKIALYSGRISLDQSMIPYLDYYKIGPYIAHFGPLNKKTTNQRLYRINRETLELKDITSRFWINDKQ